ncbi:DUF5691 domain-containing protein [Nocardiopsis sp. NPDC006938]|uniref:DUF5691 domain-containing protein n=1 Tax=Nocardiopsis sp. NPDC006938 TaxID=3364337 RepID=UPI0036AA696C
MNPTPPTGRPGPDAPATRPASAAPTAWEQLVSTALVGTSRRPAPHLPDLPLGHREGAAGLLDLAALDSVRTRAGYTAHTAEPVTPDAADPRPGVGAAADHRLDVILADRPELLPEWLAHAAQGGRRVNHTRIPDLLERAARDSSLRPLVAAVVGDRGTWLASHNTSWSFISREPLATDVHTDTAWNEGTPAQRRRALFALRATDPAAARALLAEALPEESRVEERRGLLEALAVNLGPDDEALLDQALDDRGANVRGLALALLVRLPDSAHAHRLRAHLRAHLGRDQGPPRALDMVDMDVLTADQLRDLALVPPKKRPDTREKRWELGRVLLTHAPLDTWTDHLGTDPAGVLDLAEPQPELREVLADAVCLQRNRAWARALLADPAGGLGRLRFVGNLRWRSARTREILGVLPAEERCDVVAAAIDALGAATGSTAPDGSGQSLADIGALGQVLLAVDAPWTRPISDEVVRRLTGPADDRVARGYRFLCEVAAEHMPPEHLDLLPKEPPFEAEGPAYLRLRDTLRFRLEMHREL